MPTDVLRILAIADTGAAEAKLSMLSTKLKTVGTTTGGVAKGMGAAWTTFGLAAGIAVAGFAVKAIKAASDTIEQMNRVKVVFGGASDEVVKFAENASKIGLAKAQALEAAAGFGAM